MVKVAKILNGCFWKIIVVKNNMKHWMTILEFLFDKNGLDL